MANQYTLGPPPPGKMWVPTVNGWVAMTKDEAHAWVSRPENQYAFTDPNNPYLSPDLRTEIQDPRLQAAIKAGQTTKVKVNETTFTVENGQVTGYSRGSLWKPLAAAGLTAATAGLAGGAFGPGAGATGGGTAASTGGATAAGATGPVAADVALESAAGISGGTAGGTAAGAAGAAGAGAAGVAGAKGVANWLNPLLQYGIPTAGGLIGAQIQSTGIKEAAEIQAKSMAEALAYEKERDQYLRGLESQRYSDLTGRLQPYIAIGQSAGDRMAALLGLNPAGHGYTPPPPNPPPPPAHYPGYANPMYGGMTGGGSSTAAPPPPPPPTPPPNLPPPETGRHPDQPFRPGPSPTNPRPGSRVAGQSPTVYDEPLVTMQAPDGTTKAVPASHVQHYQQLGAQVVANG